MPVAERSRGNGISTSELPAFCVWPRTAEAAARAAGVRATVRPVIAAPMGGGSPRPPVQGLQRDVDAVLSASGLAGLAATRVDGSTTQAVAGFANRETQQVVTEGTQFRVGSITKTFVALAAMRLVEAGRLDLGAPVNDYLRPLRIEWPDDAGLQVTTHQLALMLTEQAPDLVMGTDDSQGYGFKIATSSVD